MRFLLIALSLLLATPAQAAQVLETHIKVQVQGAVKKPGIYTLLTGARLVEAVAMAGGPRPDADLVDLNLTRVLSDGERCQVLTRGQAQLAMAPTGGHKKKAQHRGKKGHRRLRVNKGAGVHVHINRATADQFEQLPGVGPSLAAAIVEERHRQGGAFHALDDLREVSGLGEKRFNRMKPYLELN